MKNTSTKSLRAVLLHTKSTSVRRKGAIFNRLSELSFRTPLAFIFGLCFCSTMSSAATYVNNTAISVAATTSIVEESCYFGPGSAIDVNADLIIYSKNVWIAPTATFTGTGKIIFRNPVLQGGASSATLIDGNDGAFIPITIDHDNGADMILTNLDTEVATFLATNNVFTMPSPSTTATADLKIGGAFNMVSITQGDPFDGGEVGLNGNNFVFDEDATIHGFRDQRFVDTGNSETDKLGHMIKTFGAAPNNVFVFPVGFKPSNYQYTPARITANSGTFYVSTQSFDQSLSDETLLVQEENVGRTWHIYADAPVVAKVETQHQSGLEDNGWDAQAAYIVSRWLGGQAWERNDEAVGSLANLSDLVPGSDNNNIQTNFEPTQLRDLTYEVPASPTSPLSYSTHTFRSNTALPVTLISFDAVAEGLSANISWKTSSEVNSASFEIQRSGDAKRWTRIGSVAAHGESTKEVNYAFADNQPLSGINYYRLKMIDLDGTYALSTMKALAFDTGASVSVFPNPVLDYISINMQDWKSVTNVEIVNALGRKVYQSGNSLENIIPVNQLNPGIYVVKIVRSGDNVITKKIVVTK